MNIDLILKDPTDIDFSDARDEHRIKEFFQKYGMTFRYLFVDGTEEARALRAQGVMDFGDRTRDWPAPLIFLREDNGKVVWIVSSPSDNNLLYIYQIKAGERVPPTA